MFIKCLIGTSAFITSLFVGVALAAQPVSTGTTATSTTAEPPVKPLAFVICAFEGDNAGQKCAALGGSPTFTVPSDRTFAIEQVTGTCSTSETTETLVKVDLNVVTKGVQVDHLLLGSKQPAGPGFEVRVSDDTHIYADPGSTISVGLTGLSTNEDNRLCRLAFSGRLVR